MSNGLRPTWAIAWCGRRKRCRRRGRGGGRAGVGWRRKWRGGRGGRREFGGGTKYSL